MVMQNNETGIIGYKVVQFLLFSKSGFSDWVVEHAGGIWGGAYWAFGDVSEGIVGDIQWLGIMVLYW